ncbi:uncharacterized protein ACA1_385520 [Acanthamoeba castellanii str. Neff]|uniref:Uncharacterized protein n=1 Tax=Acanthamoeba castellanii (strain ATCC 30010 / Neff) TaxID=1257118 RepID=L8H9B6_ACACF|nr:uncharacterized protein ACA1_385520 [Acanthamoeba castellanii str. Neff]ELR21775.1 hypothetical protein ACA1_385520 [Acanthamoeba castellanii str. Neff]
MNDLVEMILLYIAKAPFALFGGGVIFFALLFFLCACYWLIAGRVVWVIRDIKKKREPVPVGYYSVARNDWVPVPLPEVAPTKEQRVYESAVYETQSNMSPVYEMPV